MGLLVSSWPHPSPLPTWDKLYTPEGDAPIILLLLPQLLSATSSHQIFSQRAVHSTGPCLSLAHLHTLHVLLVFSQIEGSYAHLRHLGLTQVPFPGCHCWTGWKFTFKGSDNDGVLLSSVKSVPDRCLWMRMLRYQTRVFCVMLIIATALLSGPQTPSVMDQGSHIFSAISHTKKAQRLKCETLSLWVFCVSGFCWRSICLSVRMMCRMVVSVWMCVDLFLHCHIHIHILKAWKTTDFLSSTLLYEVCVAWKLFCFALATCWIGCCDIMNASWFICLSRLAASQRCRKEKKT